MVEGESAPTGIGADDETEEALGPYGVDESSEKLIDLESFDTPPAAGTLLDPSLPPENLAHYQIIDTLGEGDAGMVYKAWDPRLERHVALKVLRSELANDDALIARFRSESEAIAGLKHPYIVALYDFREDEGLRYFATDHVEGQDLAHVIRAGTMKMQEKLQLFVRVLRALGHAHRKDVLHRDFRPSNVIVAEGRPHITDFGLAKALDHSGQPLYMAPEQFAGKPVDLRSDLFSAGVVFFELLCGRPPYDPSEVPKAVTDPGRVSMRRLKNVPRRIREIAARALVKDPAERYQSADAWADDLEAHLEAPVAERVGLRERLRPRLLAGLACVALTTAGMAVLVVAEAQRTFGPDVAEGSGSEPITPGDGSSGGSGGDDGGSGSEPAPKTVEEQLAELLEKLSHELEDREQTKVALAALVDWCQEHPDVIKKQGLARKLGRFLSYPQPLTDFALISPEDTGWLGRLAWGAEQRQKRVTVASRLIEVGLPMLRGQSEESRREGLKLLEAGYHLGSDRVEPRLPMARAYLSLAMYQTALDTIEIYLRDDGGQRAKGLLCRANAHRLKIITDATAAKKQPTIEDFAPAAVDLRKSLDTLMNPLAKAERLFAGKLLWGLLYPNKPKEAMSLVAELHTKAMLADYATLNAMKRFNQVIGGEQPKAGLPFYGLRFTNFTVEGNAPLMGQNVWLLTRGQKFPLEPKSVLVMARPGGWLQVRFRWPKGAKKVILEMHGEGPKLPAEKRNNKIRIGLNKRWITEEQWLFRGGAVSIAKLDLTATLPPGQDKVHEIRIQLSPQSQYQVWLHQLRIYGGP